MRAQPAGSHFIDGRFVDGDGPEFDSIHPADRSVIARLRAADAAVVEQAMVAARSGFQVGPRTPPVERGRVLHRAAETIRERNHELSVLESLDTGKPLQETLVADAASGADCLEYFAGLIAADTGQHIDLGSSFAYTRREPLGVCVGIGAWNYPIQIACWKAAPALAAGNSMIFKPSELTPLSALALAEILTEAGLPGWRLQRRAGRGRRRRSARRAPDVAKVSVTGSVPTGERVAARRRRWPQARHARARRQVTADRVRRRRPRQRRVGCDARQLLLDRAGVLERHASVRPPPGCSTSSSPGSWPAPSGSCSATRSTSRRRWARS